MAHFWRAIVLNMKTISYAILQEKSVNEILEQLSKGRSVEDQAILQQQAETYYEPIIHFIQKWAPVAVSKVEAQI